MFYTTEDVQLSPDEVVQSFLDQLLTTLKSPFTTHWSVTHLVLIKVKQCVSWASLYTNPSVLPRASNQHTPMTNQCDQDAHSPCDWEWGKGDFPHFLFLTPRQHLSPAILTFSGLLLSLFAFFLILARRFIRGNTCPAKDGLHAGTD